MFLGFALGVLSISVYRSATDTWETKVRTILIKNCAPVSTVLFAQR